MFLEESIALLERTPATLDAWLRGLPDVWIESTEGPGTWSPYIVVGHLIHCERADWMPRLEIILEHGPSRAFNPLDREAQFRESAGKPLDILLEEFADLRRANLDRLRDLDLQAAQFNLEGTHPTLGVVTLRQLIATWCAHDLTHIAQISRAMAKRYKDEVGPWIAHLSVMR